MFEILVGRTPFEEEGDDQGISTEAEYLVYWERSHKAEWLGPWSMPQGQSISIVATVHKTDSQTCNSS